MVATPFLDDLLVDAAVDNGSINWPISLGTATEDDMGKIHVSMTIVRQQCSYKVSCPMDDK